jgi:NurA-like 5'-3' nuclease
LGTKKSLVGINQENMAGDVILVSLLLRKTALLILQREVSRCHARVAVVRMIFQSSEKVINFKLENNSQVYNFSFVKTN